MTVQFTWYDEMQKVMHVELLGRWTWDEYHDALVEIVKLLQPLDQPVDFLFDLQHSAPVLSGAPRYADLTFRLLGKKMGMMIVVTENTFVKVIVSTFKRAYRRWSDRVTTFDTIEQAITFIESRANTETR